MATQATTATYVIDEATGELRPVDVERLAEGGGALVIRSGGGRVGQSFPLRGERMTIGRSPGGRRLPRRRHRVARPRRARAPPGRLAPRRLRLAQRHLRQPQPHRLAPARGRRRAAGRQVQAHVPRRMTDLDATAGRPSGSDACPTRTRPSRQVADHRRGLQGARPGVPGHLDLEDPLPRGPEAAHAAAHARRLPALLDRRRRPAAHDPAPAARRVPAAAGDPPGARARPRPRTTSPQPAAEGRAAAAPRRAGVSVRETGRVLDARGDARGDRRAARSSSPSSRTTGSSTARRAAGTPLLRRHGPRDRPRLRRARALRRRRPQPARVQDVGRPRVAAAAAAPRAVAALAQPGAPQGGDRRRSRTSPRSPRHLKRLLLVRDLRKVVK